MCALRAYDARLGRDAERETVTDHEVIDAMLALGGNFIQHLARAFMAADPVNQQRLKDAFADEWRRYTDLAARRLWEDPRR